MNIREEKDSDMEKMWKVDGEAFETEQATPIYNFLSNSYSYT